MSEEPTTSQRANLRRLAKASEELGEITREADRLYESNGLTVKKLDELQARGDQIAQRIGAENVPGWDETLTEYRDEIELAPKRAALY